MRFMSETSERKSLAVVVLWLACLAFPAVLQAQQVMRHPDPAAPLAQRWAWAQREVRGLDASGGAWVAYGIRRRMGEHATIRHGFYDDRRGRSLYEVLYGTPPPGGSAATNEAPNEAPSEAMRQAAKQALARRASAEVEKDVVMLLRLGRSGRVEEVAFANLTEPFDLGRRPLFWLAVVGDGESVSLLREEYGRAGAEALKEDLVAAVGIHDDAAHVVPFLESVLASRAGDGLREQAAFWLGQTDDPKALRLLAAVVRGDASRRVREHAVFGISQMDLEAATDELIRLARSAGDHGVREKAIFWLGQKASEKAVAALRDTVFDAGDTELQEQAVFALSQLRADDGIPLLIDVAKTHPNPEVRKQAIFWLGQSGDPRAVDLLVELVR